MAMSTRTGPGVTSPWGQIRPVTATGLFAVVEIILVSYLASPTKTETALQLLHDWVLAHRRQVWVAIAVVGVALLAYGIGVTRVGG